MSKITHFPFYIDDWGKGTGRLSALERGVYITLLVEMYDCVGPVERDDRRLSRLCGCDTKNQFKKTLEALIHFGHIQEKDGLIYNEKVSKTIKILLEKSSKARAAANAKWGKNDNKNNDSGYANAPTVADAPAMLSKTKAKEEEKKQTKKEKSPRAQYNKIGEPIFDRFLSEIWDNRWKDGDNRKEAYNAYCSLTDQDKANLAKAMPKAKAEMLKKENQFRKSLSAWIRANGWEAFEQSPVQKQNGMTKEKWEAWVKSFEESGNWHPDLGPKPNEPRCRAPKEILDRMNKPAEQLSLNAPYSEYKHH